MKTKGKNIVIIGAGEVGYNVASTLSKAGHNVKLVEEDKIRATRVENELDGQVIVGNGARPTVLAEAGIKEGTDVDMVVACTSRDEVNILACWIAKSVGVKQIISRAVGIEFSDNKWTDLLEIGNVVSPARIVAREIASLLEVRGAIDVAEVGEKTLIVSFKVAEDAPVCGLDLIQMRKQNPGLKTLIVYIQRGDTGFIPKGSDTIEAGDICYSFCYTDQMSAISDMYQSQKKKKLKKVIVVGAGKIGYKITERIRERNKNVDIYLIDRNIAKTKKASEELQDVMVCTIDATDEEELRKHAGVVTCDGFVAATDDDETNLVVASLAKTLGAGKSIAVVKNRTYSGNSKLASSLPIDAIVNKNEVLSSAIINAVRSSDKQNQKPESGTEHRTEVLRTFDKIGAETLSVTIPEGGAAIGVMLKEMRLPAGSVIGMVKREADGRAVIDIPDGSFRFAAGDVASVFAEAEAVDGVIELLEAVSD